MTARHVNPHARGHHTLYREGETTHCPGCGRTHWLIGRVTAECAFCGTALPLENATRAEKPRIRSLGLGGGKISRMLALA